MTPREAELEAVLRDVLIALDEDAPGPYRKPTEDWYLILGQKLRIAKSIIRKAGITK